MWWKIPLQYVLCNGNFQYLYFYSSVQMDELEIQQHYDEFFEEIYVEMEKVNSRIIQGVK